MALVGLRYEWTTHRAQNCQRSHHVNLGNNLSAIASLWYDLFITPQIALNYTK